jgi:hypothetical protein
MSTESQTSRVNPVRLNAVDDPVPGGVLTSGTGTAMCPGQAGKTVEFSDTEIFYDNTIGVLYTGKYQYVQSDCDASEVPARGVLAFWYNLANYVVTPDPTDGELAGVYINALTPGNWGYIQIEGLASVLFNAQQSQATPAIKNLVVQATGANTADALADGTAITAGVAKRFLGIAEAAPVAGAISLVGLYEQFLNK